MVKNFNDVACSSRKWNNGGGFYWSLRDEHLKYLGIINSNDLIRKPLQLIVGPESNFVDIVADTDLVGKKKKFWKLCEARKGTGKRKKDYFEVEINHNFMDKSIFKLMSRFFSRSTRSNAKCVPLENKTLRLFLPILEGARTVEKSLVNPISVTTKVANGDGLSREVVNSGYELVEKINTFCNQNDVAIDVVGGKLRLYF